MKIMLDAGHYGKSNRSPAVKEYYESEGMWKFHKLLGNALTKAGFEVGYTRPTQEKGLAVTAKGDNLERGRAAAGYDLLLSCHSNAVGSRVNESVDYPRAYLPDTHEVDVLAKKLVSCVHEIMETSQPGDIINNGAYYIIQGAAAVGVPCIILEHSFHTQTRATSWLLGDGNLARLAESEAAVLAEYYGVRPSDAEELKNEVASLRSALEVKTKEAERYAAMLGDTQEQLLAEQGQTARLKQKISAASELLK